MRVRIEIMVLHHNDSECRKGRKEGCWSVGSPNPRSGQAGRQADGRGCGRLVTIKDTRRRNENQRKRRCTTESKEEQQHPTSCSPTFNKCARTISILYTTTRKPAECNRNFSEIFFRPFFHSARFTALEHQHEQTGRDNYKAIYTFPVVPF